MVAHLKQSFDRRGAPRRYSWQASERPDTLGGWRRTVNILNTTGWTVTIVLWAYFDIMSRTVKIVPWPAIQSLPLGHRGRPWLLLITGMRANLGIVVISRFDGKGNRAPSECIPESMRCAEINQWIKSTRTQWKTDRILRWYSFLFWSSRLQHLPAHPKLKNSKADPAHDDHH